MRENFAIGALVLIWQIGAITTFVLGVIDTWNSDMYFLVKILVILSIDAVLASIWPITWILWWIMSANGSDTPLDMIF